MMCYQQMSDLCTYFTYLYLSCCVEIPWVNGSWGREGSRRVALDVFPVVLSCKQSSTEHQSSTENKNRHSSASFQHWENRPGARTLGLQSCREAVLADWELHGPFDASSVLGAGAFWEAQCRVLYVQMGGVAAVLSAPVPCIWMGVLKGSLIFILCVGFPVLLPHALAEGQEQNKL